MQAHLRAGQDVNFRDAYAPLPSCRVSRFLAASFARNQRFGDCLKFDTLDGCASGVRDGDYSRVRSQYSLSLTVTQTDTIVDPRGERAVLFRVPVRYWSTTLGPTPSSRPRRAQARLHRAALGGVLRQSPNRPIARRIRRRRERPGRRRVRRLRLRRIGGVRWPSPRRHLPCRRMPLHYAAHKGDSESVAELLLRGADGAVQANDG